MKRSLVSSPKNLQSYLAHIAKFTPSTLACLVIASAAAPAFAQISRLDLADYDLQSISADGKIIGGKQNNNGKYTPFLWTDEWKQPSLLGNAADNSALIMALNGNGDVAVGWRNNSGNGNGNHAIVWQRNTGKTTVLTSLSAGASASANAINADGTIIGGSSANATGISQAVIWSGENWGDIKAVDTLARESYLDAINAAGNLVAGYVRDNPNTHINATIWSKTGDNWQAANLGSTQGESRVNALSADGKTAAGYANNGVINRPVIWSGNNWQKTELDSLSTSELGGEVRALSQDGRIAGGVSSDDNGHRATIWYGKDWKEKIDLGTLRTDNQMDSEITSISGDGKIAIGKSYDNSGKERATLWLHYLPEDSRPPQIIDEENTKKALAQVGQDSFRLLSLQRAALKSLLDGCHSEQGFCYRISNDFYGESNYKQQTSTLRLGYGFGNGFSAGVGLAHSFYQNFGDNISPHKNNLGVGLFARYEQALSNSRIYIAPSVAWNTYRFDSQRPLFANSEAGVGVSRINGIAYRVTLGQDFNLNKHQLGWYFSLHNSQVKRLGYQENNVSLPANYAQMKHQETVATLGSQASLYLAPKLNALFGIQIEQYLAGKAPIYRADIASANFAQVESHSAKIQHTRYQAHAGIAYQVNPAFAWQLMPYFGKNELANNYWGVQLNFSGRF